MNIKKIINDYVECNYFEIKIKDKKVYVYYYEKIEHFSNNKITILGDNTHFNITGKKLVIETLFEELLVISGEINSITISNYE